MAVTWLGPGRGGVNMWDTIHALRDLAGARSGGDPEAEEQMARKIAGCSDTTLDEMTRAVGLFFDMANISEDHHRVRVLQQRQRDGHECETFAHAAQLLRASGLGQEAIGERLSELRVEPVLTAHPTEAKRRSVRRVLRRLRLDLAMLDQPALPRARRRAQLARMRRDLASLWYTDPVSPRKPEVMEELRRTLFAARTMWRNAPRLMAGVRAAFPEQAGVTQPPSRLLAFGNWVGGDRDGNPFVTTPVTRQALQALRRTAIRLHRRECRRVRSRLTVSDAQGGRPRRLIEQIRIARERWPGLGRRLDRLHPDEWFTQWLSVIDARLRRSDALPDELAHGMAYANAGDLATDVQLIAGTLCEIGHDELLGGALLRWRDRLACFGLHLLRLDVRINSRSVAEAVSELLQVAGIHDGYTTLPKQTRLRVLRDTDRYLDRLVLGRGSLSETCVDLIDLFAMLQRLGAAGYREALGPVIVSMTRDVTDIHAVRWLALASARLHAIDDPPPLRYVPLFETIHDLEIAGRVFDDLLHDDAYRQELRKNDNEQTCMIGYSDSAKDGGYVSASWSLHETQRSLARHAEAHGVRLTLFHGRGGAIGRGGGPAARAIRSLPPEAVDGRLRLTEQGEVIAERYDDPSIAMRHLEQLVWGTLTLGVQPETGQHDARNRIAQKLAGISFKAYRALINHPAFDRYLRQCTALPLIESLRIGSRPSRRIVSAVFEDLRAIPYTFAWNQVRMPINAFYGFGAAYAGLADQEQHLLRKNYATWPWLQAVVDNTELALARCDPAVTRRYAGLAEDPPAARAIWDLLNRDFEQTVQAVLAIKGEKRLLEHVGWLRRSISIRTPYLDILNLIQIELMSRRKRLKDENPALEHALRRTVQAIASGLRNTG